MTMHPFFRWAAAGFGHVAAGGHHHGIVHNHDKLVGFTTTDQRIRDGDATHVKFNWGTIGLRFDPAGMTIAERPTPEWFDALCGIADAVIVCVPTPAHRDVVGMALEAGFDCIVEKPMAPTASDARAMVRRAFGLGRKLLVAHVLPAIQEFGILRETIVQNGVDTLEKLHMYRYVPWTGVEAEDHIATGTGYYADLGVHDNHLVASLDAGAYLGSSSNVERAHGNIQRATVGIGLKKAPDADVTIDAGANPDVSGFAHGFEARWKDGSALLFRDGRLCNERGPLPLPAQTPGQVFGEELRFAAEVFRTGCDPEYLCPDAAVDALELVEAVK